MTTDRPRTKPREIPTEQVEEMALAILVAADPDEGTDLDEMALPVLILAAATGHNPPTPERMVLALNRLANAGAAERATGPYERGGEIHTRWRITLEGMLYAAMKMTVAREQIERRRAAAADGEPTGDPLDDLLRGNPWDDVPIN